jgi:hypothetical protein
VFGPARSACSFKLSLCFAFSGPIFKFQAFVFPIGNRLRIWKGAISAFPCSFAFRPTRGRVLLPYGEVACFQGSDEPPLSEGRWSLDDLKRWLCPLCHRLLTTVTLTPCCSTSYCDACITEALLADD